MGGYVLLEYMSFRRMFFFCFFLVFFFLDDINITGSIYHTGNMYYWRMYPLEDISYGSACFTGGHTLLEDLFFIIINDTFIH